MLFTSYAFIGFVILLVASLMFTRAYFKNYNSWALSIFMPGYGDAMVRAYEIAGDDRTVYSTYDGLSSPFMLALYYTNYSPVDFHNTVVYKDPDAEFRVAESYGNFVFGLPDDALAGAGIADKYRDDVFVLSKAESAELSDFGGYVTEEIGGYMILYK